MNTTPGGNRAYENMVGHVGAPYDTLVGNNYHQPMSDGVVFYSDFEQPPTSVDDEYYERIFEPSKRDHVYSYNLPASDDSVCSPDVPPSQNSTQL